MENINDRIKNLRKDKLRLTQAQFGAELGYSQTGVSEWEQPGYQIPHIVLLGIAQRFSVSMEWLLSGRPDWRQHPASEDIGIVHQIPIIGRACAGYPDVCAEDVVEYVCATPDTPEAAQAVRAKGDSMEPEINSGDIVIFLPNGDFRHGTVVVVADEFGDLMVKRYKIKLDGTVVLTSDNSRYPEIIPNSNYRVLGPALEYINRRKPR